MAYNFSWIIEDRVGGMGRPSDADLVWLRELGVTAVLTLTEWPLTPALEVAGDLDILHVPVPDMHPPTLNQLHAMVGFMDDVVRRSGKVVAHCMAGVGRTGTALAAYLVGDGMSAPDAIKAVRALRPGSIETSAQEAIVAQYAELIGEDGDSP